MSDEIEKILAWIPNGPMVPLQTRFYSDAFGELHGAPYHGELSATTPQNWADFQEYCLHGSSRSIVIVGCGLRFGRAYRRHFNFSWRGCSAASWPRPPAADRSR